MGRATGICALFLTFAAGSVTAQTLRLRIVQGDNAINSIRMHRGHDPVVQVLNESGAPVPHATVSFLLPGTGASGTFGDRGLSTTVETDSQGMAAGRGLAPNRVEGQFQIRVTASWQGEAASAAIPQTNAEPAAKASRSKWIIAVVVAGGAAGGAIAALSGGKSSGTAASGSTGGAVGSATAGGTIVPGSPSLGPPH